MLSTYSLCKQLKINRIINVSCLFRFFKVVVVIIFVAVRLDVEVGKQHNQSDKINAIEIKQIPAVATINSQDNGYVNHNYHKLSLFEKERNKTIVRGRFITELIHAGRYEFIGSLLWLFIRLHDTNTKSHSDTSRVIPVHPGIYNGLRFLYRYHLNAV